MRLQARTALLATLRSKYPREVVKPYSDGATPGRLTGLYPGLLFGYVPMGAQRHWFFHSEGAVQCFERWYAAEDADAAQRWTDYATANPKEDAA